MTDRNSKIRVGLVTTEFLPVWGGIASYCINLCRALSDKVEFHVFTISQKAKEAQPVAGDRIPGVQVHYLSSGSNVSLPILGYQISLARRMPRLIKEYDLDLVHSAAPLADQLLRIRGVNVPHVLTYHSTLAGQRRGIASSGARFKDLHGSEKLTLLFYPPLRLFESLSLRRTKNIIAVSKALRDELVNSYHYKGQVTFIPNGIGTEMFQPNRKENGGKRVLFSGRLIALKGPQFVIKAIPQVLKKHPDALFIFAAAGNREPYLRMLQELNISANNFEFCYVNYPSMPELYSSSDILVLPSLLESSPMSILEAMACGLPVIASDVGDVAQLVRKDETGLLIGKGNHEQLAKGIDLLLGNEALQKKMSQRARSLVVANYSAEIMGQRTLDLYHQVLEEKR